jgi:peroxiredoxin
MKYRIPALIAFVLSITGLVLILLDYRVIGLSLLVPAYAASLASFKTNGGFVSGFAVFLPAAVMAWAMFAPGVLPLLPLALIISSLQNDLIELFFPRYMYTVKSVRVIMGVTSIVLYILANVISPSGWQAWTFPGLIIFLSTLLSFLITKDLISLEKTAEKGFIAEGRSCPAFILPDENGNMISSADFLGKHLLIIFVRGDWCPGCHITLRSYQRNKEKFAEKNVHLLSIGPDPLGVNKEMVQKLDLDFHVLSDENQRVAQQFCVELQQAVAAPKDYEFVPLPASFLIDKTGTVRFTSRADRPGDLFNPEKIFEVLGSMA